MYVELIALVIHTYIILLILRVFNCGDDEDNADDND
jgi:hypothetical protein